MRLEPTQSTAVFYGVDPVTLHIWKRVVEGARPYVYIDNGYFNSKWKGGDFYRITAGAMQHQGQLRICWLQPSLGIQIQVAGDAHQSLVDFVRLALGRDLAVAVDFDKKQARQVP